MNPDVIELLTTLVSTKSYSREEEEIAGVFRGWFADHGVEATLKDNNVIVEVVGEEPGPTLLLNSHTDTVPAKDGWETDPWTPTIKDGRLYGLGSGDAKASVSAMACATVQIAKQGLPRGKVLFVASVMEEIGRGGLEFLLPELGHIDSALVGEPTNLEPALAQGGLLLLTATARGRTAHAARAHLGENALTKAARDLIKLDTFRLEKIHPWLGPSTANVTVIQGGDRHNVIPDACQYTLDIRYTPSYSPEEITAMIDELTEADIAVRSDRLRPVETAETAAIVRALKLARPELKPFGSPTMSDWVHLGHVNGIKIGPGDSEYSHTPNESVSVFETQRAVDMYRDAALAYCAIDV